MISPFHLPRVSRTLRGFTLVEVLVALAVLAVLLTIIAQVLGQVQRVWSAANSRVAQFREARRAMDRISSNLAQATMNSSLQYYYAGANPFLPPSSGLMTAPQGYVRYSDLQFLCGPTQTLLAGANQTAGHSIFFQAPTGGALNVNAGGAAAFTNMPTAISACGYYVAFDTDANFRPSFLNQRNHPERQRFRLYEYRPPIDANLIYKDLAVPDPNPGVPLPDWYNQIATWSRPVAENIIFLVFSPKRAVTDAAGDPRDIAPAYTYNSSPGVKLPQATQDYQLPPLVEVTLVALDESSAQRLAENSGGNPTLPEGLFTSASDTSFRSDIEALEDFLNDEKLNYRVFTATVPIRNSKWGL